MELKTRALSSQNPSHHSRVQLTSIKAPHNPNLPRWSHNMCTPLTPNPPQPPVRPTLASSPPAHWPPRSRDQTEASDWSAGRDQSQLFAGGAPGRLSCPPSSSACRREHTLLLPLRDCPSRGMHMCHTDWVAPNKQTNKLTNKQVNK